MGRDEVRGEVEMLWGFHERRLDPHVPSPRLLDRVAFSEDPPLRVAQCAGCGLVYRNPIERPGDVVALYEGEAPPADTLRALHDVQRASYWAQARRLLDALGRPGDGIEVGSYVGAFLAAARDVGLRVEGLDVNPRVNAFTRSLGFAVHDGDLESFAPEHTVDAVAIWNCFDQLPDPRGAVGAARRLLRPGGVLAIRVPNGGFYARLRDAAAARGARAAIARALLAHNNLLTFPYRFGFTPRSITHLLDRAGFTVERTVGDVLVPIADEYTRSWGALEERLLKTITRLVVRQKAEWAPWFEVYARKMRPELSAGTR